jgi:hypothetical protein
MIDAGLRLFQKGGSTFSSQIPWRPVSEVTMFFRIKNLVIEPKSRSSRTNASTVRYTNPSSQSGRGR